MATVEPARKWLLYGGNGWIGGMVEAELRKRGEEVVRADARADDQDAVAEELRRVRPTHVFCAVGRTHGPGFKTIDYLEQPGKLTDNLRDNLEAPLVLAALSAEVGAHCSYIGTGCIYTSSLEAIEAGECFGEEDAPNFCGSSYSTVKGATDRLMRLFPGTLNLRIRMPIDDTDHPRNFITKMASYKSVHSMPNSMTVLPVMIPLMVDMATRCIVGTFNMVNPGLITHDEVLTMYKELVDEDHVWTNVTDVKGLVAAPRSNNHLRTTKLQSLYPDVPDIHSAVRVCITAMAASRKVLPE